MAPWIIHSFIAMLGFGGIYISLKLLTDLSISSTVINFYFFGLATIGFLLLAFLQKVELSVPKKSWGFFAILTLASLLGNYYSVKAYATAPNPGYAAAIISAAVLLLTAFSVIFLGSDFNLVKASGILLVVAGVIVLTFA